MFYKVSIALICSICAVSLVKAQNDNNDGRNPRIVNKQQPVYAQSGYSFTLVCEYKDPGNKGVLWYHDNQPINADQKSNFNLVSEKTEDSSNNRVVTSTLTKNLVNSDDGGSYECRPGDGGSGTGFATNVFVVTDKNSVVESSVNDIEILNRIKRDDSADDDSIAPQNDTLEVGKNAELGCRIEGDLYTKATFKWYRSEDADAELKNGDKYDINDENDTLTIKNTEPSDAGQYICKYTMADDKGVFQGVVSLNAVPFVRNFESKSKNLVQGDPLTVNCKVYSEPDPVISWYKDETPLDTSDPRVKLSEHEGLANASLRIEDLDFDDRAVYMCSATNELGVGNNTVMVRVKELQQEKGEPSKARKGEDSRMGVALCLRDLLQFWC